MQQQEQPSTGDFAVVGNQTNRGDSHFSVAIWPKVKEIVAESGMGHEDACAAARKLAAEARVTKPGTAAWDVTSSPYRRLD